MELNTILEGVDVHGIELFAYALTVAELFDTLPTFDADALPAWEALIESNAQLSKRVLGNINVEYTTQDPYKNFNDLLNDVLVNHHLSVFKTPDGTHPGMSPDQNDLFRALHDALTHVGSNTANFFKHLAHHADTPYKPLWGGTFTVRGEMNAYLIHAKMAPQAAIPALYTEVVGQICYYFVTGNYAQNKVAIIPDVDFINLGECTGYAQSRMQDIIKAMNDPTVESIQTNVNNISIPKSKIKWKLLSKGTGAGNI